MSSPRWMKRRRLRPPAQGEGPPENLVSVTCAFCKGRGRDPYGLSPLSNCVVCGGRKTVMVREPYETCGACEGTGLYFRSHMYCWTCRGKGVIPLAATGGETGVTQGRQSSLEEENDA